VFELCRRGGVCGPGEGKLWWGVLVVVGVVRCCGDLAAKWSLVGCCGAVEPVGLGVFRSCGLAWWCALM
jgi:hypothetical protein